MTLEKPRRWTLALCLLAVAIALFVEFVAMNAAAVGPEWVAGVPRSIVVFGGAGDADLAAKRINVRKILCMLRLAPKETPALGGTNARSSKAL
jgi:hypothetical protein